MNEDLARELEELAAKWDATSSWYGIDFPAQLRAVLAKHKKRAAA